jgi:WD40 repeat protein
MEIVPKNDEVTHLEALESTLHRRRRVLEIQRARYGDITPAQIILELEDIEQELARVQQNLRQMRSTHVGGQCPYVGLVTFQEDDATFFFGRDALVGEMLSKVEHSTFLAVLGPSGSGKSSVVRAGLIPTLKRGGLPGSDQWFYLPPLKPSARPLNALAATLTIEQEGKLGDIVPIRKALSQSNDSLLLIADGLRVRHNSARIVLVIDQAEELWTFIPTEPTARMAFIREQQQLFINNVLTAACVTDNSILVILTMRADFLHRAIEHHDLARLIGDHDVMVSPLLTNELRDAIERPAKLAGTDFEPGLVDKLVEQTLDQPGALPLLEYTLLELWKDRRADGKLTWESYKRIGGVEGGLARRADSILTQQYTLEQQAELRSILLRLIQPGEGTVDTRRRARIDDLVPVSGSVEVVHTLLKPLVEERLVTTGYDAASDDEMVELSHEALIHAWPTLSTWIAEARDNLRFRIRLEEVVKEWQVNGENSEFLWDGLRLANAEAWLARVHPQLNEREQRFFHASRSVVHEREEAEKAALQRELEQTRSLASSALKLRRRAIYLAAALFTSLIAATIAMWYWYGATKATEQANLNAQAVGIAERRAFAQFLVAKGQTIYTEEPLIGGRLAIEGLARLAQNDSVHNDLARTTVELIREGRLRKLANDVATMYQSPDKTTVVLVHIDNKITICHIISGTCTTPSPPASPGYVISFSPNSRFFMVQYGLQYKDKHCELRRSDTGQVVSLPSNTYDIQFSPNSKFFVVQYSDNKPSELRGSDNSRIARLPSNSYTVNFSPDSKFFFMPYGDKPGELRRTATGEVVPLSGDTSSVSFSPDSNFFFVQHKDLTAELRRTDTGEVVPLSGDPSNIHFSPNSQFFVVDYGRLSNDKNKPSELRRSDTGQVVPLPSNTYDIQFSPNSKFFVVQYTDKPDELWRTGTNQVIRLADRSYYVRFSPDSRFLVAQYAEDKPDELWHIDTGHVVPLPSDINDIRFSPDSQFFVAQYGNNLLSQLRRTDTGEVVPLADDTVGVIFSPDSKFFNVYHRKKRNELWTVYNTIHRLIDNIDSVTFDQEGHHAVALYYNGQVYLLDEAWLETVAAYPEALSDADLIEHACGELFSSKQFDVKTLQLYLGNQTPESCR